MGLSPVSLNRARQHKSSSARPQWFFGLADNPGRLLVKFEAYFQLSDRFIGRPQRVDSMASKVMRGFPHVHSRATQGGKCFANFGMRFRDWSGGRCGLWLGNRGCRNGNRYRESCRQCHSREQDEDLMSHGLLLLQKLVGAALSATLLA